MHEGHFLSLDPNADARTEPDEGEIFAMVPFHSPRCQDISNPRLASLLFRRNTLRQSGRCSGGEAFEIRRCRDGHQLADGDQNVAALSRFRPSGGMAMSLGLIFASREFDGEQLRQEMTFAWPSLESA
jgi:hypothetical protein